MGFINEVMQMPLFLKVLFSEGYGFMVYSAYIVLRYYILK